MSPQELARSEVRDPLRARINFVMLASLIGNDVYQPAKCVLDGYFTQLLPDEAVSRNPPARDDENPLAGDAPQRRRLLVKVFDKIGREGRIESCKERKEEEQRETNMMMEMVVLAKIAEEWEAAAIEWYIFSDALDSVVTQRTGWDHPRLAWGFATEDSPLLLSDASTWAVPYRATAFIPQATEPISTSQPDSIAALHLSPIERTAPNESEEGSIALLRDHEPNEHSRRGLLQRGKRVQEPDV